MTSKNVVPWFIDCYSQLIDFGCDCTAPTFWIDDGKRIVATKCTITILYYLKTTCRSYSCKKINLFDNISGGENLK